MCTATCQIETGWACSKPGRPCTPVCGDGLVRGTEQYDDHNRINGDGCDNTCSPTGCGNGIKTRAEQCDDGNTANSDGCESNCTRSPGLRSTPDAVVLPVRPLNVALTARTSSVNKTVSVTVRNGVAVRGEPVRNVQLTADPGTCPAGMLASQPDFDNVTPGLRNSWPLASGASKIAKVPLAINRSQFAGAYNKKAPVRCTLTFTASIVPAPSDPDPSTSNNVAILEVSVTDSTHPTVPVPHETYIKSVAPLAIWLTGSPVTRKVALTVGNGDVGETAGHAVTVTAADGTCPPGSVGVVDLNTLTAGSQPTGTVKGGMTQSGSLPVTISPTAFTSLSGKAPARCVAQLSVTGPSGDTEGTNNTTQLIIDVVDRNDY